MPRIFDAQLFEDTAQNLLFIELNHKQPDIKILSTSIIINTSFGVCFFWGVNNFDASSPTLMPLGAPQSRSRNPSPNSKPVSMVPIHPIHSIILGMDSD